VNGSFRLRYFVHYVLAPILERIAARAG